MSDDGSISIEMIQALRTSFSEDPTGKIVQNALTNGHLIDVALDRSLIQRTDEQDECAGLGPLGVHVPFQ